MYLFISLYIYSVDFFFFTDPSTTEIYTLSLHDALPISFTRKATLPKVMTSFSPASASVTRAPFRKVPLEEPARSEEHTSELQSRQYLVCRLLLEKKKKNKENIRERIIEQVRLRTVYSKD